jgi:DNA invertase Pin-like site-specific DNA recombinase
MPSRVHGTGRIVLKLRMADMKCPYCGKEIRTPTPKQIEAYRIIYIEGKTENEAACKLNITRQAVNKLLLKLQNLRPDLFATPPKILSYCKSMDYKVKMKF